MGNRFLDFCLGLQVAYEEACGEGSGFGIWEEEVGRRLGVTGYRVRKLVRVFCLIGVLEEWDGGYRVGRGIYGSYIRG